MFKALSPVLGLAYSTALLLMASGCSDGTIGTSNNAPEVLITAPAPGAVQTIYEPLILAGVATDSGAGAGDLTVTWVSSISGTLFEGPVDDGDGNTSVTIDSPAAGEHTITLRAVDPLGASGSYSVPITLTENTTPSCEITWPVDSDEIFDSTEPFLLQGQVSDDHTAAEALDILWLSSVDGELDSSTASEKGVLSAEVTLSGAEHEITLTVTDEEGLSCTDSVSATADGAPSMPGIEIQPQPPSLGQDLVAVVTTASIDPEGEAVSYSYRWRVDDVAEESVPHDTVPADRLIRGQVWAVEVFARDPQENLSEPGTATTIIPDTAPSAPEIAISPATPTQAQDLLCEVTTESIDSDPGDIITYSYAWEKDSVSTGLTGNVLAWGETAVGENWGCTVRASDGTLDGDPATDSVSISEGCTAIEGTGSSGAVVVLDHSDLRLSGTDFAVEAWVRPDSFGASSGEQAVVSKRGAGSQNGWYLGVDTDGYPFFQTSTGDDPELVAGTPIEASSWSHLALSYEQSAGTATLYVNGISAATGTLPGPSAATAQDLWIGNDSSGLTGHAWDGLIDDVRLSSVVRYSVDFIPSTAIGGDANTIAWWGFEEQSGSDVHDLSGNGHEGVVALLSFSTESSCAINLPPTDPVISLSSTASNPDYPDDDSDLSCELDNGSMDPEGQAVTYSGLWLLDGSATSNTFTSFPATLGSSETSGGDLWSCQVVASDGVEDSGTITQSTRVGEEPICSLEVSADTAATTNCSFSPPIDGLLRLTVSNDDASEDGHFVVNIGPYGSATDHFTGYRDTAYNGNVVDGWTTQEVALNLAASVGTLTFDISYTTDSGQENTGTDLLSADFVYYDTLDSSGATEILTVTDSPTVASSTTTSVTVAEGQSLLFYADLCGFGGGAHGLYLDTDSTMGNDGAFRFNTGWTGMCDYNNRYRRVSVEPRTYSLTLAHEDDNFGDNTGARGTTLYLIGP